MSTILTNRKLQAIREQAPVSCNAAYSTPCSRVNAELLATTVAQQLHDGNITLQQINSQEFNLETGFYPFVFDAATAVNLAHGKDSDTFVGHTLYDILQNATDAYVNATELHERFQVGGWVQYLTSFDGVVKNKLSYVVSTTIPSTAAAAASGQAAQQVYVGVGYENQPLPYYKPCSDSYDDWCSYTNVRSLVGQAQFKLYETQGNTGSFEAQLYALSKTPEDLQGSGFYTYIYDIDNRELVSHGIIQQKVGKTLGSVFVETGLGSFEEGDALHDQFHREVLEHPGGAWLQYFWRNSIDEQTYKKIAFVVPVELKHSNGANKKYYIGSGFNYASDELPLAPDGEICSAESNLPCAFRTSSILSSHAMTHLLTSKLPIDIRMNNITESPDFKTDEFYVFVYGYDGYCRAHGRNPGFVNMTLQEVIDIVDVPIDGNQLHEKYKQAASQGGGWVLYEWTSKGKKYPKISYLFQMNLDGEQYYGGIGFKNVAAKSKRYSRNGKRNDRSDILCSKAYDLTCSELNAQTILGQAVADLTVASSDGFGVDGVTVDDVLARITEKSNKYVINDFAVAVFSVDSSSVCDTNDGSGCCIADANDASNVGKTWQEILDIEEVTSVKGFSLHSDLTFWSNNVGGHHDYLWSGSFGSARTKRAYTGRFRDNGKDYYVLSEYFKTPLPATCDSCPRGMKCTRPQQSFCELIPDAPFYQDPAFIAVACVVAFVFSLSVISTAVYIRQKKRAFAAMAEEMNDKMEGMCEIVQDVPFRSAHEYLQRRSTAIWYWKEDSGRIHQHTSEILLDEYYVAYPREISAQIEATYERFEKDFEQSLDDDDQTNYNIPSQYINVHGTLYKIDLNALEQSNLETGHVRKVRREGIDFDLSDELRNLPPLPHGIAFDGIQYVADTKEGCHNYNEFCIDDREKFEEFLPTCKGQIIQVSKVHSDGDFVFGSVLYDPLLDDAVQRQQSGGNTDDNKLKSLLVTALHNRPTSGWFPKIVAGKPDVKTVMKLLQRIGGENMMASLEVPNEWTNELRLKLRSGKEYNKILLHFMETLYDKRDYFEVVEIERIQNPSLYQSYEVKKLTMMERDDNDSANEKLLFHGTDAKAVDAIITQGFNRRFGGRNGDVHGQGVYFARDSVYSCRSVYSTPDENGIQYMFVCRVAVGEYCLGTMGQRVPNHKLNNPLELYDTTVNNLQKPEVYVTYHDSQACADYLISFREKKNWSFP